MLRFCVLTLALMVVLAAGKSHKGHHKEKSGHHHKEKHSKHHHHDTTSSSSHHHDTASSSSHHQEVTMSTVHRQDLTIPSTHVRELILMPPVRQHELLISSARQHELVSSTRHREITLSSNGWTSLMDDDSHGYSTLRTNTAWTVKTDVGSSILVRCPMVRFPGNSIYDEERCTSGRMTFSDGYTKTTHCGSPREYVYQSKSSVLDIDLEVSSPYGASMSCECKTVRPLRTEIVHVEPDTTVTLYYPQTRMTTDKAWRFISTSEHTISLDCTTVVNRSTRRGGCMSDILTIDSGRGVQQYCGQSKASCKGTDITMRAESFSEGRLSCVVRG